jgi:23S rRNA (uridine2552-2'-O)-methyltransferase
MTDALHQFGRRARARLARACVANIPLADSSADFDEFVVGEGAVQFVDHAVGEAGVAEHHDGTQGCAKRRRCFFCFSDRFIRPSIVNVVMPKRTKSSARWLAEHASDEFVKRAQARGLAFARGLQAGRDPGDRAAAAARNSLRRSGRRARRLEPVCRAHRRRFEPHRRDRYTAHGRDSRRRFRAGRLSRGGVLEQVLGAVGAAKVDLVLSDMAPNMAGIDAVDQPRSMYLAELALEFADRVLAPGGDLLVKLFQGAGFEEIIKMPAPLWSGGDEKAESVTNSQS